MPERPPAGLLALLKRRAQVELSYARAGAGRLAAQLAAQAAMLFLALLLAVMALAMAAAAAFVTLAEAYGPALGALFTAGGLFVAALICALLARPVGRLAAPARPGPATPLVPPAAAAQLAADAAEVEALAAELRRRARQASPKLTLAALAFGIAVGVSPRLRRLLRTLID